MRMAPLKWRPFRFARSLALWQFRLLFSAVTRVHTLALKGAPHFSSLSSRRRDALHLGDLDQETSLRTKPAHSAQRRTWLYRWDGK